MRVLRVLFGIGAFLALVVAFWLVRLHFVESRTESGRIEARLTQVAAALDLGRDPDPATIRALASEPETRNTLRKLLVGNHRPELFPAEFATQEAWAESDLATWLAYPTELDQVPDEMGWVALAEAEGTSGPVQYVAFRFRTHPPHWSAKDGWMLGVSGPYRPGEDSLQSDTSGTFSSFKPVDEAGLVKLVQRCQSSVAGTDTMPAVRIVRSAPGAFETKP